MEQLIDLETGVLIDRRATSNNRVHHPLPITLTQDTSFSYLVRCAPIEANGTSEVYVDLGQSGAPSTLGAAIGSGGGGGYYVEFDGNYQYIDLVPKFKVSNDFLLVYDSPMRQCRFYVGTNLKATLDMTGSVFSLDMLSLAGAAFVASYNGWGTKALYSEFVLTNDILDKWNGAIDLKDIITMNRLGNYIPERRHAYVLEHLTCQEKGGNVLHSCVEQYNYAKDPLNFWKPEYFSSGHITAETGYSFNATQLILNNVIAADYKFVYLTNFSPPFKFNGTKYRVKFDVVDYVAGGTYAVIGSNNSAVIATANGSYITEWFEPLSAYSAQNYPVIFRTNNVDTTLKIENIVIESTNPILQNTHAELIGFEQPVVKTNLFTDSGFNSGITGWSGIDGATLSNENNKLKITTTASYGFGGATYGFATVAGKEYIAFADIQIIDNDLSLSAMIAVSTHPSSMNSGTYSVGETVGVGSSKRISVKFIASASTTYLFIQSSVYVAGTLPVFFVDNVEFGETTYVIPDSVRRDIYTKQPFTNTLLNFDNFNTATGTTFLYGNEKPVMFRNYEQPLSVVSEIFLNNIGGYGANIISYQNISSGAYGWGFGIEPVSPGVVKLIVRNTGSYVSSAGTFGSILSPAFPITLLKRFTTVGFRRTAMVSDASTYEFFIGNISIGTVTYARPSFPVTDQDTGKSNSRIVLGITYYDYGGALTSEVAQGRVAVTANHEPVSFFENAAKGTFVSPETTLFSCDLRNKTSLDVTDLDLSPNPVPFSISNSKTNFYESGKGGIVEAKTGLPEIKNALKSLPGHSIKAALPTTMPWPAKGFAHFDLNIEKWNSDPYFGEAIFRARLINFSGTQWVGASKEYGNNSRLEFAHGAQFFFNRTPIPEAGVQSLTFTWDYEAQVYETLYNGVVIMRGTNSVNPNFNIEEFWIGGRSETDGAFDNAIARSIFGDYVPDKRTILELCSNTQFANKQIKSLFYYIHEDIFNDAGTWKVRDHSGNNYHGRLYNYTANELNPAHADYAVEPLNRLRINPVIVTKAATANMQFSDLRVTKVSGGGVWNNGGSVYDRYVNSGDAVLEVPIYSIKTDDAVLDAFRMIGFSSSAVAESDMDDFNYAIYTAGADVYARVPGSSIATGQTIAAGDKLYLKIEGTVCKLYKNSTLIYTFAAAVSGIQYVQTVIFSTPASWQRVKLTGIDIKKLT